MLIFNTASGTDSSRVTISSFISHKRAADIIKLISLHITVVWATYSAECLSLRVVVQKEIPLYLTVAVSSLLHALRAHRKSYRYFTISKFTVLENKSNRARSLWNAAKGQFPWIIQSLSVACDNKRARKRTLTWIWLRWNPEKRHICTLGRQAGRRDWPEQAAVRSPERKSKLWQEAKNK